MQTLITSKSDNLQLVQDLYAAYNRGDIPYILGNLSPNVTWLSRCEETVPWGGDFTGRVPEFFNAIAGNVDVQDFQPEEHVSQGDTVISMGTFSCRAKSTGKSTTTRWIFVWKVENGMVTYYEQFHDPKLAEIFRP